MKNERLKAVVKRLEMIDKALPLSYSKAMQLDRCPAEFQKRYIEKSKGVKKLDSPAMKVGKVIHRVFEYCLTKGLSFGWEPEVIDFDLTWKQVTDQMQLTLEEYNLAQDQRTHTEVVLNRLLDSIQRYKFKVYPEASMSYSRTGKIAAQIKYDNRLFHGVVDYFSHTPNWRGMILDFKSHRQNEDRNDLVRQQLLLYTYLIFQKYPKLQHLQIGCAYIPDETIPIIEKFSRKELPELEDVFLTFIERYANTFETTDFGPKKNIYCKYCIYAKKCILN